MSEAKEKKSKRKGRVAEGKDIGWIAHLISIFDIEEEAAGLSEGITNAWLKEHSTMQMAHSKGVVIALGPSTITFNRR